MATLAQIEDYRRTGDQLGRLLTDDLKGIWQGLDLSNPREVSAQLQLVIPDLVGDYGDMAATLAADFYEEVTADYGLPYTTARLAPPVPAGQAQATTRWALGPLFSAEQSYTQALNLLIAGAHRLSLQPGRDTIAQNSQRVGLAYARVPGGAEPCAFCLVLASRGAVYGSAQAARYAKDGTRYHDDCRCAPVPMRSDADMPKGYDLAQYQKLYDANAGGSLQDVTASLREAENLR